MRKGRRKLLGLAALASLMLIGGTWAAWTQEIQTGNEFMPGKYNTSLDEAFDAPSDWQPGKEQEKKVWISNKGTVPVMAKAVITQQWIRRENVYATSVDAQGNIVEEPVAPLAGEAFPLTFETGAGMEYAAIPNFNRDTVVLLASGKTDNASLSLGLTAVSTVAEAKGKWLLMNEEPDKDNGYTLYYVGIIEPGSESPAFLNSVTLNDELARTITGKTTYHVKQDDGSVKKVTVDKVNSEYGYDSAKYTMEIKGTTVQATKAAVAEVFGQDGDTLAFLADKVADSGIFTSSTVKTLKFESSGGKLVYTPYRTDSGAEEGNWFMSFTDMVPGGIYKDKLNIENASGKDYDLYMQVIPRTQDEVKNEILDLITMKVTYNGTLLYDGKATGASLVSEEGIQRVVPLGRYTSRKTGTIEVELQLDPTLKVGDGRTEAIAGVLSKIDWKFMATEVTSGGGNGGGGGGGGKDRDRGRTVNIPDSEVPMADATIIEDSPVPLGMLPKTGDNTPVLPIIMTVFGSGIILLYLGMKIRRKDDSEN